MTEGNSRTSYTYNAMNQLVSRADSVNEEAYVYDRRGNLGLVMENGTMKNSYTYGALNRLEQAASGKGEAVSYTYNGLGFRVGKTAMHPETEIQYTIDLTRSYHNLLQKEDGGKTQSYLWDGNVAGMAEGDSACSMYYFQDELGSPVRLTDQNGELTESYGYDEFGKDLYGNQGLLQPFGYTGYQMDRTAETYFAQAREYRPELGRFISKDSNYYCKLSMPLSWNFYIYCANNSMRFIDPEGSDGRDTITNYMNQENDIYGIALGIRWLFGNGEDFIISSDEINPWQAYMKDNAILTGKVGDVVIPIGNKLKNGESIKVDMNMSMIIDNGECAIGYQFLHGTNADAGGFQITGNISKDNKGSCTYDLVYTRNDIIDPNLIYSSDQQKAESAKTIPFASMKDYKFSLSWHDVTVIKSNPGIFNWDKGWLKNYSTDWTNQLDETDSVMLEMINYEQQYILGERTKLDRTVKRNTKYLFFLL